MVTEVQHETCGPMKLINTPVKFSESTPGVREAPPTLGRHTNQVLENIAGLDKEEINVLRKEGVVV